MHVAAEQANPADVSVEQSVFNERDGQLGYVDTVHLRPSFSAPSFVVPQPQKGARTRSPGLLLVLILRLGGIHTQCRWGLRHAGCCALLRTSVSFWMTSKHRRNGSRRAAVAVMISLWVALWALEVSPDLHRLLHEDAQSPGHHLFSHSIPAPLAAVRLCSRRRAGAARYFDRPDWLRRLSVSSFLRLPADPQPRSSCRLVLLFRAIPALCSVRGTCVLP